MISPLRANYNIKGMTFFILRYVKSGNENYCKSTVKSKYFFNFNSSFDLNASKNTKISKLNRNTIHLYIIDIGRRIAHFVKINIFFLESRGGPQNSDSVVRWRATH